MATRPSSNDYDFSTAVEKALSYSPRSRGRVRADARKRSALKKERDADQPPYVDVSPKALKDDIASKVSKITDTGGEVIDMPSSSPAQTTPNSGVVNEQLLNDFRVATGTRFNPESRIDKSYMDVLRFFREDNPDVSSNKLASLVYAKQRGLSPEEFAKDYTPQEGESEEESYDDTSFYSPKSPGQVRADAANRRKDNKYWEENTQEGSLKYMAENTQEGSLREMNKSVNEDQLLDDFRVATGTRFNPKSRVDTEYMSKIRSFRSKNPSLSSTQLARLIYRS